MVPKEVRDEWKASTTSIQSKAIKKSFKVAIVGRTEAGKSTLLNALLNNQILSASASGACTAVVTEISYQKEKLEAVVEFISEEEWRKTLCRLIEDATDTTVDTEEGPADNSKISLAQQARTKIIGVYPYLESVPANKWAVQDLLNDTLVRKYLGTESSFSAMKSTNFQKELEQFLASALSSGDARALWPLVKIVKIMGPFDVLATGVTLVDLPGTGDVDNVRNTAAEEYMITADAIVLVSNIVRAQDDRDVHATLYKLLSQIILDGRVQQKSILLVLTGTDNPIGTNEIKISRDKQEIVDALEKEATELGKEITRLQTKKDRKENSRKVKPDEIAGLKDQITEKRGQKSKKVKAKNRILALERSASVTKSLRKTYQTLYRDISRCKEDDLVPSIPVFCIGSRDFLSSAQLIPDDSAVFDDQDDTQIPRLRSYLQDDGERRSLMDAIVPMTNFCNFLFQFSSPLANASSKTQELEQIIEDVQDKCGEKLQQLLDDIKEQYSALMALVKAAVCDAEKKSPKVIQEKETFKWNQYRAMVRQDGLYEGGNLNADLTKDILPAVQTPWFKVVNNDIPLLIGSFCDEVKELLEEAVQVICLKTNKPFAPLRRSLGIDSFITHLKSSDIEVTASAQRQGSRGWEPMVRKMLIPHYRNVAAEKGPGMYKRMKLGMQHYIRGNASQLFGQMNTTTKQLFDETVDNIASHDRLELSRFVKVLRQSLLGVDVGLAEAEKLVRDFAKAHEDRATTLLDDLKIRLNDIRPVL
ncbi:hypothetical protein C8R45DRAFT_954051 [Mycena sanguinolenta]|nr:hypothetical protein C8R45DRAFT_954051 [Mycena sanguinolenta]